jgi:hypothetical protein
MTMNRLTTLIDELKDSPSNRGACLEGVASILERHAYHILIVKIWQLTNLHVNTVGSYQQML